MQFCYGQVGSIAELATIMKFKFHNRSSIEYFEYDSFRQHHIGTIFWNEKLIILNLLIFIYV